MPKQPRPVVRVTFEFYPKRWPDSDGAEADREQIAECRDSLYGYEKDYRRPRLVSIKSHAARRGG